MIITSAAEEVAQSWPKIKERIRRAVSAYFCNSSAGANEAALKAGSQSDWSQQVIQFLNNHFPWSDFWRDVFDQAKAVSMMVWTVSTRDGFYVPFNDLEALQPF